MNSQSQPSSGSWLSDHSQPRLWADQSNRAAFDVLLQEFDGLGEQEVLRRVETGAFDNRKSGYAREWLAYRNDLLTKDSIRGLQARAQQAHDIARDSHRLVVEAGNLARASDNIAREAKEIAEKAVRDARSSSTIAILALIIAAAAIATALVMRL